MHVFVRSRNLGLENGDCEHDPTEQVLALFKMCVGFQENLDAFGYGFRFHDVSLNSCLS